MSAANASKRQLLKAGLAVGAAASRGLSGNLAFAQGKPLVSCVCRQPCRSTRTRRTMSGTAASRKNLKTAVGNKIVVNYFPSDQLGKKSDVVNQVRLQDVVTPYLKYLAMLLVTRS